MRHELKRKVLVECKLPKESGRYSDYGETEYRDLTAYEAVKQWAKESMLDVIVPRSLHLEDAIRLLQKNFKISRESAYRRAIRATGEYACLSFETVGRNKYIVYNKALDSPEEDQRMLEERKERQKRNLAEIKRTIPPELTITEEEEEISSVEPIIPETEEEPLNDIYTRLMKTEKRRKEELSSKES